MKKCFGVVIAGVILVLGCAAPEEAKRQAPAEDSRVQTFVLDDTDGNAVDIANAIGEQPVVLVFYRGVW